MRRIKKCAVRLPMLALWLGRLDDDVDETAGDGDLSWRDRAARYELLRLADHDAVRVMRRLGERQGIEHHRLFVHGAITVGVDGAGPENANVDLEAAIEHEIVPVDPFDRDVVRRAVTRRLVDLAALDPRVEERAQADPCQVARPACCNRTI